MSKQTINLGAVVDDFTGDYLRQGGEKINDNFAEAYSELGDEVVFHPAGAWKIHDRATDGTTLNIDLGQQYHIKTSAGAVTVVLPAVTLGDVGRVIKISDAFGFWTSSEVLVQPTGATINGSAADRSFTTNYSIIEFVLTDVSGALDWKYLPGLTHQSLLAEDTSAGVATSTYVMGQDDIAGVIIVPGGYNPDAVDVFLNGVMMYYDAAGLGNTGVSDYGSGDITSAFIALNGQNLKIRSGKYKNDDIVTVKSYSNSLVAQTPSYKRYSITIYDALAAAGLGYTQDNPGSYIIRANFTTVENCTFTLTDFGAPAGLEFLYNGTQAFRQGQLLTHTGMANLTGNNNYQLINDANSQLNTIVFNPASLASGEVLTVVLFTNELGILLPWEGQDSVKSRGDETWVNAEVEISRTNKIGFISIPAQINDMTEAHTDMNFAQANQMSVADEHNIKVNDVYSLFNTIYPIGTIYENNANPANPAKYMGFGTWVPYGEGKVIFGYEHGDPTFSENVTGGQISVTLGSENIPPLPVSPQAAIVHNDDTGEINITGCLPDTDAVVPTASLTPSTLIANEDVEPNEISTLPPYAVAYRWVRVA